MPGALLLVLACALVGHLWMQSAGAHAGADGGTHAAAHGQEAAAHGQVAAETDTRSRAAHQMAAGCIAVLAVVALMGRRAVAVVRRDRASGAARVAAVPGPRPPARPPRLARAPVEHGVLLRV